MARRWVLRKGDGQEIRRRTSPVLGTEGVVGTRSCGHVSKHLVGRRTAKTVKQIQREGR